MSTSRNYFVPRPFEFVRLQDLRLQKEYQKEKENKNKKENENEKEKEKENKYPPCPNSQIKVVNIPLQNLATFPKCIFEFRHLTHLNIAYNNMLQLPSSLVALVCLRQIDCSHNLLTWLPTFGANVRNVNCSNNKIVLLPTNIFQSNIASFNCDSNRIIFLPYWNDRLQKLHCENNRIRKIVDYNTSEESVRFQETDEYDEEKEEEEEEENEEEEETKTNKKTNKKINQKGKDSGTGPEFTTKELVEFLCSFNELRDALPAPTRHLKTFVCRNNRVTELPSLQNATELITLDCSSNHLSNLSNDKGNSDSNVFGCRKLYFLLCSGNKLRSLPCLKELQNLKHIYCVGNQLEEIADDVLPASLEIFLCSYNKLKYLPKLGHCRHLHYLHCDNNLLRMLPPMPPNLRELRCEYNKSVFCLSPNLTETQISRSLKFIDFVGTPFHELVFPGPGRLHPWSSANQGLHFKKTVKVNTILTRFRELYFMQRFKRPLRRWFMKSQQLKIEQRFHYKHLTNFLSENNIAEDDNETLENWLNKW
jgi:Leucine-rich repeat (LRR) protein